MSKIFEVELIPALADNYIFLLHHSLSKRSCVIDPCSSEIVIKTLEKKGRVLDSIWNTHHHGDHTGGNLGLLNHYQCKIYGAKKDAHRIPGLTDPLVPECSFEYMGEQVIVLESSGHTLGAISFWIPDSNILFPGDTIFAMGCGRLFEGSAQQMWASLERIKKLPLETMIYCAHEYTLKNSHFAHSIDPDNTELNIRIKKIESMRSQNISTVPFSLKEELDTNPFMRTHEISFKKKLGMDVLADWEVFKHIRELKDSF